MTFELATLLMFLNVNLRLIFSTLPMLPSHVSSPAPTNNILVTYGALQVLYCNVLYCTDGEFVCVRIEEILKQRRAAQTAVDRPNVEALKRAREIRLKQIEMNAIIKECIIYLVFVFVVYFISYQERDFRSFLFAQNVKNQFFGGKPSFSSVSQRRPGYYPRESEGICFHRRYLLVISF